MRKIFTLYILLFITIFQTHQVISQSLECCKSIKEVETFLNGDWKKVGSEENRIYRFEFSNGLGKSKIFQIKEDGSLELDEKSLLDFSIVRDKTGFQIEYDLKYFKAKHNITLLDSLNITTRVGNKKPSKLYRVSEL